MAVTHTTVGFKGTVDQIGEAQRMARLGPRFSVASAASWAISPAAGDRTVAISAGSGQCCGVLDTTTAVDTVQLPANGTSGTGTRFDLIIARFKWTDPVTAVGFTYVAGTPGAGVPKVGDLVRTPGGQYDAVIGVVRVAGGQGALSANDIFRLAPCAGGAGRLVVPQTEFVTAVDGTLGDRMEADGFGYEYRHNGTGWTVVGTPWLNLHDAPTNYSAPALASWTDLPQLTGNIFVVAGVTAEIELHVPKLRIEAVGRVYLRLTVGGTPIAAGEAAAGADGGFEVPAIIRGSYLGTNAIVAVAAQIKGADNGGYVRGTENAGPRLRYRLS